MRSRARPNCATRADSSRSIRNSATRSTRTSTAWACASRSRLSNLRDELAGGSPTRLATWNAICLADFGDTGMAFVALPQIPPRNVTWTKEGRWVHLAKVAFERYYLRKMRRGSTEPVVERYALRALGIERTSA